MTIEDSLLLPGNNRVRISDALTDRFGNALQSDFTTGDDMFGANVIFEQQFLISPHDDTDPVINEAVGEQSYLAAAELPMEIDLDGTGWFRSSVGRGYLDDDENTDWFKFNAFEDDQFEIHAAGDFNSRISIDAFTLVDGILESINPVGTSTRNFYAEFDSPSTQPVYVSISGMADVPYDLRVNVQSDGNIAPESLISRMRTRNALAWSDLGSARRQAFTGTIHPEVWTGDGSDYFYLGSASNTEIAAGQPVQVGLRSSQWTDVDLRLEIVDSLSNVLATTTTDAGGFLDWAPEADGHYFVRVSALDGSGNASTNYRLDLMVGNVSTTSLETPVVQSVQVNGGSRSRSLIETVQVTLDAETTVSANDFELIDSRGGQRIEGLQVTSNPGEGKTVVELSFDAVDLPQPNPSVLSSPSTVAHALGNGDYQLRYRGGPINPASESLDEFFALYGDVDGSGSVGLADFAVFRASFGRASDHSSYESTLDSNRDARIGIQDFAAFRDSLARDARAFIE